MGIPRHVAVIDIGKTNAKLALVDASEMTELAVRKVPNRVKTGAPYPHHDVEAIWAFILDGLVGLNRDRPIDAVVVTTHGATVALMDADGELALPVLDYEHQGPDNSRGRYEAIRPDFTETGSPPLPAGLNLGAQLFWQADTFPRDFARVAHILPYPQYWAFRLSGIAACEATSLGAHTDLWNPHARDFSSLVDGLGWRELFAPMRRAGDRLGPILPAIAERTGLHPATPVFCGIHDSNASLLPHLITRTPPFAVVSTGTWVISMAIGSAPIRLDPARDTLINVNAQGEPVSSARFMGGREFETILGNHGSDCSSSDLDAVLSEPFLLLPQIHQGAGPYMHRRGGWHGAEPSGGARYVAASFYLALNTAKCLDLIGAEDDIIIEGPHGGNEPFLLMLAAAMQRPVTVQAGQATGTSIGAALLAIGTGASPPVPAARKIANNRPAWRAYAEKWFRLAEEPPEE